MIIPKTMMGVFIIASSALPGCSCEVSHPATKVDCGPRGVQEVQHNTYASYDLIVCRSGKVFKLDD